MIIKFILFAAQHVLSEAAGKLFDFFVRRADDKQLKVKTENEVRPSKGVFYIGLTFCVMAVFFGSPVIFFDNIKEKIDGLIGFLVVIPLGLIPVILYLNLRYNYDSYGFSYRNVFRKMYEYSYSQISELNVKPYGLKIQMSDGKRIYIFSELINNDEEMINTILKYVEDKNVS